MSFDLSADNCKRDENVTYHQWRYDYEVDAESKVNSEKKSRRSKDSQVP